MRPLRPWACLCALTAAASSNVTNADGAAPTTTPQLAASTAHSTVSPAPVSEAIHDNASIWNSVTAAQPTPGLEEGHVPVLSSPSSHSDEPPAVSTAMVQPIVAGAETWDPQPVISSTTPTPTDDDPPLASPSPSPPQPTGPEVSPAATVGESPQPLPLELEEVPPAPEFLSFNEWRERYVVQPDPSGARRGKKRPRQETVAAGGASGAEAAGGFGEGFGAGMDQEDTLPTRAGGGRGSPALQGVDSEGHSGASGDSAMPLGGAAQVVVEDGPFGLTLTTSSSSSPIQPLPYVGTGELADPLVHLKDRTNYAGAECAAKLHRSSRQSKGASSILTEKKDRYMLTPCSATPKFVDVELCDEIQIDALVLANFEFFSSTFKHFKASCSVDYPGKPEDWHDLGTFRARNVRGLQVFRPLSNPPFCRYVRIDFLSHFGSEYYCPVSLLRVYGYTQLESFRESERKAKAIQDALDSAELIDEEADEHERAIEEAQRIEVEMLKPAEEKMGGTQATETAQSAPLEPSPPRVTIASHADEDSPHKSKSSSPSDTSQVSPTGPPPQSPVVSHDITLVVPATSVDAVHTSIQSPSSSTPTSATEAIAQPSSTALDSVVLSSSSLPTPLLNASSPSSHLAAESTVTPLAPTATASTAMLTTAASATSLPADSVTTPATARPTLSHSSTNFTSSPAATTLSTGPPDANSNASVVPPHPSPPQQSHSSRNDSQPPSPSPSASPSHIHVQVPRAPHPLAPPAAIAQPQPGESIYGTIMKRLASLEHNQTLAMGFIEAQSGMLREAFGRVERRLSDLEGSRSRQEQSIRQSLLELEKHRFELERERLALTAQVSLLTQEIRSEKRLTVVQLFGLLLLVIFVGFTRGVPTSPFLHLASASTSMSGPRTRRPDTATPVGASFRATEEKIWEEQLEAGHESKKASGTGAELPRRTHRVSPSASLSRHQPAKRSTPTSKPGALRRHYGPINGSSAPSSKNMSRSWTPPIRHSSAPPEDLLGADGSALVDASRRRAIPRAPGSAAGINRHYEFPQRSPALSGAASPARDATASRAGPSLSIASPSASADPVLWDHEPRTIEMVQATEKSASPPMRFGAPPFPLESIPSFDGYQTTYSSDDEVAHPLNQIYTLSPSDKGKGKAREPSPTTSLASSVGGRPPKPHVPPRPATVIGIHLPSNEVLERLAGEEKAEGRVLRGPSPSSALPSPPPEPEPSPPPTDAPPDSDKGA